MRELPKDAVAELEAETHTTGKGERVLVLRARDAGGTVQLAVVNLEAIENDPPLLEDLKKAFVGHVTRMVAAATGEPEADVALGVVSESEKSN